MKLSSFLHKNLIKVPHRVQKEEYVIKELVNEICKDMPEEFKKEVIDTIIKRENKFPTAMNGIAIPHARIPGFSDLILAISIPEKPIYVNGEEVHIFFLILTGEASHLYLNLLSAIAKLCRDQTFFNKIINSKKPKELIEIVDKTGIRVKRELFIKDIMNKNFPIVSSEDSLETAIDTLLHKHSLYVFVIENDKLVGELTLCQIIEKKMPDYVEDIENLEFLKTLEPVEKLLKDEEKIKVKEVMSPVKISLAPDDSIPAAVVIMVREKRDFIPVVENGKVIGVATLENFIKKVLRA